jgi:hypothetical protein
METFSCFLCGKEGFRNEKSIWRHQKRSKICRAIAKLPRQPSQLKDQMAKVGMILVEKPQLGTENDKNENKKGSG